MADETITASTGAAAEQAITEAPSAQSPAGSGHKQVRILLAEDNAVNQRVALLTLQRLGFMVDAVANGREALAALATTRYSIVFMDCQMPVMDGYETTAEIRGREAGTSRHTVIIAMTAHALQGEREKCLAAGMDDYLSKPVKLSELELMLERWSPPLNPTLETVPPTAALSSAFSQLPVDIFDPAVLDGFRELQPEGGQDIINELLELYRTDAGARLGELRVALIDEDMPRLERAAHSLKGGSHSLGIQRMTALSIELERQLHNHELAPAGLIISQLETEFAHVMEACAGELQTA